MRALKLLLLFPLMMALGGCTAQGTGEAEDLALTIRGSYLASPLITASCTVTADYGERVYQFSFDTVTTQDKTTLTLTSPQQLAGLVVEIGEGDSALSYQGVLVDTGALDRDGLTPITAVPALIRAVQSEYIERCSLEEGVLRLLCRDPDVPVGTGRELVIYLEETSGDLLRGEIFVDGTRKIDCTFESISWGGLPQG